MDQILAFCPTSCQDSKGSHTLINVHAHSGEGEGEFMTNLPSPIICDELTSEQFSAK